MRKDFYIIFLACFLSVLPLFGCSAKTVEIPEEDWNRLVSIWTKYEMSTTESMKTINALEAEFKAAKEELNGLKMSSTTLTSESVELQNELIELKNLHNQQEKLLKKANLKLERANESLKESKDQHKKKVQKEKNKKTAWQIIAIAATIWAVSK